MGEALSDSDGEGDSAISLREGRQSGPNRPYGAVLLLKTQHG